MGRKPTAAGDARPTLHHSGKYAVTTTQKQHGKRTVKTLYGDTPQEAKNAHAAYVMGLGVAPSPRIEFQVWVNEYLNHNKRDISTSTQENYDSYLNRILPAIGQMRLEDITAWILRPFFDTLDDLSSSTRLHIHDFLKACFQDAVNCDLLEKNPMLPVKRPKLTPARDEVRWDTADIEALFRVFEGHRLALFPYLCITLGLRIGEALALTWDDFKGDTLEVLHTLDVSYRKGKNPFRPCKKFSMRRLALDAATKAKFEAHRLEQLKERDGHKDWNPFNLVLCSKLGTVLNPCNVRRMFAEKVQQAGIPYGGTHVMRKAYASLAADHLQIHELQARLGHSDPRVTLKIYAKVLPSRSAQTALPLSKLLNRS
jgi:integrase